MIDFEAPEYTVVEDAGNVSLCLRTSTGNVEPVTIVFYSRHVTTSGNLCDFIHISSSYKIVNFADGDYRFAQTVLIPASPGSSRICVDIPIVDDIIVENPEDFIVTFEGPPETTGVNTTTRVVIVDNDRKLIRTLFCIH